MPPGRPRDGISLFDGRWQGFPGGAGSEIPPASAEDVTDAGSIPGSGRSPGEENGNSLQYSCPGIPWTEEPGGLQSMGVKSIGPDWACAHLYNTEQC